jgi:stage II sporulation SpoE-like protein
MTVTAAVGCCALGLQSLPTALAAKDAGASTTPASSEEIAAPRTRRAERAERVAKAESCCTAVAPAIAPPPPEAAPETASAVGPGPRRGGRPPAPPRRERVRQESPRRVAATSAPTPVAAAPAGASSSNATVAHGAEALARKQKKGSDGGKGSGGGKEKGAGGKKQKEKAKETPTEGAKGEGSEGHSGEAGGSEEQGSGKAGTKTTVEPLGVEADAADAVAVAASVALPVTNPSSGTGTTSIASISSSPAAGSGTAVRARRVARGARRRAANRPTAGSTLAAASPVALFVPAAATGSTTAPPAPAAVEQAHSAASTQPAIVKTITRIVGVVPTPVRILIAALIALALALAVRSLMAMVRTRRLVRQRGQLLEDVGLLQAALLPVPPERLGPVGTSVAYRPADGPGAGGDFYDVFALEDGQLAVIVGDVSGHGRDALPHTALVRFTVRAYLEAGLSPSQALQTAGSVLERQLAGSFATVVAAKYHPRERTLTYAAAGHPPPVVVGEPGPAGVARTITPVTSSSAPPVGAGMRTGTRETVVSVPGPAQLCFHTDGVTEARVGEELFGAERLTAALAELGRDADAPALLDSVAAQTDARPDDMAACLLCVQDGAGAPTIVSERLELDRRELTSARTERFLLDCGVEPATAAQILDSARDELDRVDGVVLELSFGEGAPVVSLRDDNVIHTAALAAASAS